MQTLSPQQSDAVLDLVQQALLVTHTFEYATICAPALARHRKETVNLRRMYVKADFLGIESSILMSILSHNLPASMSLAVVLPATHFHL
jgi:hypothetical protein